MSENVYNGYFGNPNDNRIETVVVYCQLLLQGTNILFQQDPSAIYDIIIISDMIEMIDIMTSNDVQSYSM